ncbi:MAG: arginase family protein [Candidatus Pacearchaeota archaeon]|jgi:arginase family enzyme
MQIIRIKHVDSGEKTKGCEKAPIEILKSLKCFSSNEAGKLVEFAKLHLEEIHVDSENIQEANHLIFENSKEAFEMNFKTLFIGGDHSISYSIGKAFNKIQENPLLIVFDSHGDCLEGGKLNRSWLKKLIEAGFEGRNLVLIGARNLSVQEIQFIKENGISWIKMDILREELEGVCDLVMERARKSGGFYISIDISCVDPGFAMGASELEPGGISSRDLIYFIKRLVLLENFRGADIVEINPDKDINEMTIKLGSKLLSEMI